MIQYEISILLIFCLIGGSFSDPNKYKDNMNKEDRMIANRDFTKDINNLYY